MSRLLTLFVLGVILVNCYGAVVSNSKSTSLATSNHLPFKFSMVSERDDNGHWTEKFEMEHDEHEWDIETNHNVLTDEEDQPIIQILVTFKPMVKETSNVQPIRSHAFKTKLNNVRETGEDSETIRIFDLENTDWFGAKKYCEDYGGHLAIPNSQKKINTLRNILNDFSLDRDGKSNSAFVGFHDQQEEGHFVTIFGDPVFNSDNSQWSPKWYNRKQPDDDKSWTKDGEDCGSINSNGGLNDVPCNYNLPFFCEGVLSSTTYPPQSSQQTYQQNIPTDIELELIKNNANFRFYPREPVFHPTFGDSEQMPSTSLYSNEEVILPMITKLTTQVDKSFIQYFRDPLSWLNAKQACETWGGHLAILDSQAKLNAMGKILNSGILNPQGRCSLLGFSYHAEEDKFVTIFGDPVFNQSSDFTPRWWQDGEPSKYWNGMKEDCGSLHPNGGLNDVPCDYELPYFCERNVADETMKQEPQDILPINEENESESTSNADIEYNNIALKYFKRKDLNFYEAQLVCKNLVRGKLATLKNDVSDNLGRWNLFSLNKSTCAHVLIGTSSGYEEYSLSDANHANKDEYLSPGEICGCASSDNMFRRKACTEKGHFFCQFEIHSYPSGESGDVTTPPTEEQELESTFSSEETQLI